MFDPLRNDPRFQKLCQEKQENKGINADRLLSSDVQLELAHVLFIDIVGYSKRLINEQTALVKRLNELVLQTEQCRTADAAGKLIRIPTGDGMALAFFTSPDAPVRCAMEHWQQGG